MEERQRTSDNRSVMARSCGPTAAATFVINDFATELRLCRNREIVESSPFRLAGRAFAIGVYPNGDAEEHAGFVGVFLRNKGQDAVKVSSFKITVGKHVKETAAATIQGGKGWGWPKFLARDASKEVVEAAGGDLQVTVEVEMLGRRGIVGEEEEPAESSGWVLENLYRLGMASADFMLVCAGGEEVAVHRQVLLGASPYFLAMLSQGPAARVARAGVECAAQTARKLVTFLYTNRLEGPYFDANLAQFLALADRYLVAELKRRTESRMIEVVSRGNMVEFLVAGERSHGARVREAAKALIQANLVWLKQQVGWKARFGEEKELLVEVLE